MGEKLINTKTLESASKEEIYRKIVGTSFKGGIIKTNLDGLELAFGPPFEVLSDKTYYEWVFHAKIQELGKTHWFFFTLYDWKQSKDPALGEEIEWHIGALTDHQSALAKEKLNEEISKSLKKYKTGAYMDTIIECLKSEGIDYKIERSKNIETEDHQIILDQGFIIQVGAIYPSSLLTQVTKEGSIRFFGVSHDNNVQQLINTYKKEKQDQKDD